MWLDCYNNVHRSIMYIGQIGRNFNSGLVRCKNLKVIEVQQNNIHGVSLIQSILRGKMRYARYSRIKQENHVSHHVERHNFLPNDNV